MPNGDSNLKNKNLDMLNKPFSVILDTDIKNFMPLEQSYTFYKIIFANKYYRKAYGKG
jgi:hypothetical protein